MSKALISSIVIRMPSFIKLPEASQCIYFHSLMDADNAGIVNLKTILDITHIKETYVTPLVNAKYIQLLDYECLAFLTHWRLHNINYDARFLANPSPFLELLAIKIPDAPIYAAKIVKKINKKGVEYDAFQRFDATASEAFAHYYPQLARIIEDKTKVSECGDEQKPKLTAQIVLERLKKLKEQKYE